MLQQFLAARENGMDLYLDADEVLDLLDYLEVMNDFEFYDEILELGLNLHPFHPDLIIKRACSLAQQDRYVEAMNLIKDMEDDVDNEDLEIVKMGCFCALDQYPKAREIMDLLIEQECDYLEGAFEDIAILLNDLEKYPDSRDLLNTGLSIFPRNTVLRNELCYVLQSEGDTEAAIKLCNQLIDEDPYSSERWITLGRIYAMDNNYEKAIEALDFAIAANDDPEQEIRILRAYCLYMNESYERAIEEYKAITADGDEELKARIYPLLADCEIKLERFEDAYQRLGSIINSPYLEDGPAVIINYIRCCIETRHSTESLKVALKAIRMYPDNVQILSVMLLMLMGQGMTQETIPYIQGIINLLKKKDGLTIPSDQAEEYDKLLYNGHNLYAEGDMSNAIHCFEKVLELNPKVLVAHIYLALAYLETNDQENFEKHMRYISYSDGQPSTQKTGYKLCEPASILSQVKRQIRPEDLTKDYLSNKENCN